MILSWQIINKQNKVSTTFLFLQPVAIDDAAVFAELDNEVNLLCEFDGDNVAEISSTMVGKS